MNSNYTGWVRLTLFNLLVVAIYGVTMRYKIGFEFPHLEQKYLQHAHSHFAFAGWISQALFLIIIRELEQYQDEAARHKYTAILAANTATAYGMLISFTVSGYSAVSIVLSTASTAVFFLFAVYVFRDVSRFQIRAPGFKWIKAALAFGILSSIGTFYLARLMANGHLHEIEYLASIYFYLHFQYNGWFFFACMGAFMNRIHAAGLWSKSWNLVFILLVITCIPAYLLSVLWMNLPVWLYVIGVLAALLQFIGWIRFLVLFRNQGRSLVKDFSNTGKYLLLFAAAAATIKWSLQLGSVIPEVSQLAFGFRTIVIAYLHLVLLATISVFILAYLFNFGMMSTNRSAGLALILFTSGIFLTEFLLLIQGVASFTYVPIPYANEMLFFLALVMLMGILMLFRSQLRSGLPDGDIPKM